MSRKKKVNKKSLIRKIIWWIIYLSGGSSFAGAAESIMNYGVLKSMSGNVPASSNQGKPSRNSTDNVHGYKSDSHDSERFAEHKYDRNVAKIYMLLWGICAMLFAFYFLYHSPLFGSLAITLAVALLAYLFLSVKIFSQDYELEEINGIDVIVPGPLFHFSLTGGRANDVFIDYENRMRSCLLQANGLPEKMNDATVHFECIDFDDDRIVFRFYFQDVLGAYEFLKNNSGRFATQFGDPDGADVTKVRDDVFDVVFDQMKNNFNSSANVRWAE